MVPCGVSDPESLSEMRAVITRLDFPRPLEGSSLERCRSTSTEESLAEESARGWGFHLGAARAFRILAVNQGRAALELYAQHTASHRVTIPSTISGWRGGGFLEANSLVRRRGAFPCFIILSAA